MVYFRKSQFADVAGLFLILNGFGLISSYAFASMEAQAPWSDTANFSAETISRAQFASNDNRYNSNVPDSLIEQVLQDDEHKIDPEFRIYPEFQAPTKFWLKIYSQYSTKDVVVYDSSNMNIIYEVIDLRPIERKSRNAVVFEILSDRKVKKTLAAYRKAFLGLAKNHRPKQLTREQELILSALKNEPAKISWKQKAAAIKTMKGQRDPIIQGLINGEEYFPLMERTFIQAGVPVELSRLCLVESSFNPKAGSKVGASGIWQIMPAVGKQYLKMNESKNIDERLSPLKSSIAAAKLLKFNYKFLGSWILAVVSYNHGYRGLPRLKPHTYKFEKIAHLFHPSGKKKEALGWASKNYYSEYLAILHASMYAREIYGELPSQAAQHSFQFEQLTTPKTAIEFIHEKRITTKEFVAYNGDIQDLRKPLIKGLWVSFPGNKPNYQEVVDYSLTPHKSEHARVSKAKLHKKHTA